MLDPEAEYRASLGLPVKTYAQGPLWPNASLSTNRYHLQHQHGGRPNTATPTTRSGDRMMQGRSPAAATSGDTSLTGGTRQRPPSAAVDHHRHQSDGSSNCMAGLAVVVPPGKSVPTLSGRDWSPQTNAYSVGGGQGGEGSQQQYMGRQYKGVTDAIASPSALAAFGGRGSMQPVEPRAVLGSPSSIRRQQQHPGAPSFHTAAATAAPQASSHSWGIQSAWGEEEDPQLTHEDLAHTQNR